MNICVYCASSTHVPQVYADAARETGHIIGSHGHTLVYGGTNVGLMGVLADAARSAGGYIVGIIPRQMADRGLAYSRADELIITDTMAQRKEMMEARANAFIALPGGFGTLEELAQVITLKQLGYVSGPIALVNTAGFYDYLLQHFERLYLSGFANPAYRRLYAAVATPREALEYVETYEPQIMPNKWEGPSTQ